jgi:hypothetical protein
MICDYINKFFDETVEKHKEIWRESHLMDYLDIGQDHFPVPGGKNDGRLMCYVNAPYVRAHKLDYLVYRFFQTFWHARGR